MAAGVTVTSTSQTSNARQGDFLKALHQDAGRGQRNAREKGYIEPRISSEPPGQVALAYRPNVIRLSSVVSERIYAGSDRISCLSNGA